ncbi:hypothetical protein [Spirosoma montaniterrae]|uniref:Prevent-host-death protein n=1 Tax=Spirosoma montaniterrae TaxID=1178516 RepID=A0A1P9X2D3_9BACT|nr:hypothetical protein [Spirosoma montaniterrae]AQG81781.1 hypothetical protein AWR27_22230 [Spirosoma montaniterrae]
MNVQYISNQQGKRTAVVVPIKEWNKIKKKLDLPDDESVADEDVQLTKEQLIADVKEALEEVKLHKQGKIKLQSLDEFLNEL